VDAEGEKSLAQQLAKLAVELSRVTAVDDTVETIVDYARQVMGCTQAGIALNEDGRLITTVVSDPLVRQLYEIQLSNGEGPLVSAFNGSRVVLISEVRNDDRWPAWRELALSFGLRTVLQLPLRTGTYRSGVLTLYSSIPDAFDAEDVAMAELVAHHAAGAITWARERSQLEDAVASRRLIGQAVGVLMMRHRLTQHEAFDVLKRYSQETNTRLREVAGQLVTTEEF